MARLLNRSVVVSEVIPPLIRAFQETFERTPLVV
jgi:hypothetical protein